MKKTTKLIARGQRGMTLLEIMIVLAILALVMGLVVGPRVMKLFGEWSQAHPDKSCPDKLEDLSQYMDSKDTKDPWGNPYKMFCGQNLPAGAKGGLAVMSSGPDGKDGTEDDVKSW